MDTEDTRNLHHSGSIEDSETSGQLVDAVEPDSPSQTPSVPAPALGSADGIAKQANTKLNSSQITTGLIIFIVVVLFIMLMLSINGRLFQGSSDNGDLAALESQNAQLRADVNAERARRGLPPVPSGSSDAHAAAARIQQDANSLASLVNGWQQELANKDATIDDLQEQMASRDEHAKHLYNQIATLQNQLDQSANAAGQLITLGNDLKMANQQIESYRTQLAELQGRPTSTQHSELRQQLNESLAKTSKLELQVEGLLQQSKNNVDQKRFDEAVAELDALRPQLNEQRYEIQRLRALLDRARLFIESEDDLPVDAARLFAKLRTLDTVRGTALVAAYKDIEKTLGARVIHRQSFATGSSQIAFDRETMIKNALGKGAGVDSFFLVVGYASKTGDAASNRKLSAARATTAASVVNLLKTEQQEVCAVYLGQTNRFSQDDSEKNQICEVWEIKR